MFHSSWTTWFLTRAIIFGTVTALKDIVAAISLRVSCGPGKSSTLGFYMEVGRNSQYIAFFESFQWGTQKFCCGEGSSTNSVEDRGQRERGSGGGSP
jgi:hypothetical protein